MKRRTILGAVTLGITAALVVLAGCTTATTGTSGGTTGSTGGGTPSDQAAVTIQDFEFVPTSVTIKAGGTVTWTNKGPSTHTVTGDGGLDSGDLAPDETYAHTFDTAGTYNYSCSIHPSMQGAVVVQ